MTDLKLAWLRDIKYLVWPSLCIEYEIEQYKNKSLTCKYRLRSNLAVGLRSMGTLWRMSKLKHSSLVGARCSLPRCLDATVITKKVLLFLSLTWVHLDHMSAARLNPITRVLSMLTQRMVVIIININSYLLPSFSHDWRTGIDVTTKRQREGRVWVCRWGQMREDKRKEKERN